MLGVLNETLRQKETCTTHLEEIVMQYENEIERFARTLKSRDSKISQSYLKTFPKGTGKSWGSNIILNGRRFTFPSLKKRATK